MSVDAPFLILFEYHQNRKTLCGRYFLKGVDMAGFAMASGLIVLFVGLTWFIDKLARRVRGKKLTMPLIILILGCVISVGGIMNLTPVLSADASQNTPVDKVTERNLSELTRSFDIAETDAEQVLSDIRAVGIVSVSGIKSTKEEDKDNYKSFTADADGKMILIRIQKEKTYYIGIGDVALFDASKGGVLRQIKDYGVRIDEADSFMTAAEGYVESAAKYPSSVNFPGHILKADKWDAARYRNVVQVESYVEAKNGMGAVSRSRFVVQMTYDKKDCLFMSLNGKQVYGKYSKMSD